MAGEDRKYSRWIRSLPCAMCGAPGPSDQHHLGGAGMALRSHDHESLPLCFSRPERAGCHVDGLHSARGRFAAMGKDQRKAWERETAARLRSDYLSAF